jgi:CIC family chloride channel protein
LRLISNIKRITRFYRYKINHFFSSFAITQDTYLLVLGGIIGLISGFGAVVFHEAIRLIKVLFFDDPGKFFGLESLLNANAWYIKLLIILIPAIGGLIVGIMAHYFEGGKKGEGIPNVIDAIASRGGIIKGSVAIIKTIGSAVSIGTGGAGGKEGPIVQIGASIGSAFGQYLSTSSDRIKILVGCGAGAGLSAAFNAPIGGALFAMEIILHTFNAKSFSPIIIASVFGTVISRAYLGNQPAFQIPNYNLVTNTEFIFYIVLGILAAFTAVYFVRVFLMIDTYFDKIKKVPKFLRPAIGGLGVGVIALYFPGVYEFNYNGIVNSLAHPTAFWVLLALVFFKPIATSLTIGSGGNGGTFAPSIFTGAMLGGCFGQVVNYFFPSISAPPGAYALVGMGAVVAGTTHASLTALIMVFEMTGNYKIILPLMLSIIISTTLSKLFLKGSLYTIKFAQEGKGIDIYGRKVSILKNLPVFNMIEHTADLVGEEFTFKELLNIVKDSRFTNIMVKNNNDRIVGQIEFQDIRNAVLDEETRHILQFLVAGDLMTRSIPTIGSDKNCEEALSLMEKEDLEYIPVVNKLTNKYMGIVTKESILKKYQNELFIMQNENELAL